MAAILAIALAPFVMAPHAAAQDEAGAITALKNLGNAFADITEQTSPAVVFIRIEKRMSNRMSLGAPGRGLPEDFFERFFGIPGHPMPEAPDSGEGQGEGMPVPVGQGSGFIFSPDGHIITNHHVVDGADNIVVTLSDGREFEATVVGSDAETEIAVVKIEAEGLPTLKLGNSDTLRVGEWVLAIGNPFGLSHSVTAGIVSARGRSQVNLPRAGFLADFIQTDAAINPGNSGGPLLNLDGEVVGLNTAILSRSGGYMGIGFAIPINMVEYVTDQLIKNGKVVRGFVGIRIQNLDPEMSQFWEGVDQGVLVAEVMPDTPAAAAGVARDDVIVALNGQPVADAGAFKSRVSIIAPGENAELTIMRNGEKITKTVTVAAFPDDLSASAAPVEKGVGKSDELGVSVQDLNEDLAERFGYEGAAGVIITEVKPNSPAAFANLREGALIQEVNRKPVANVDEFNAALEQAKTERSVLLRVRIDSVSSYVAVKINR
ncbi:MAG: Do family serine endopeptidase [Candidatus Hydrogenedentes bacterium]|nr:Do family serine endopeptidase [Candidatus Hydrogenedentota bacterium]